MPLDLNSSEWLEVRREPFVYQRSESGNQGAYLTVIKDCDLKSSTSTLVATRQLLVGLKDLKIQKQEQVDLADSQALRSEIRARLEDKTIDIVAFNLSNGSCFYDFVLWQEAPQTEARNQILEKDCGEFSKYLGENLGQLLR